MATSSGQWPSSDGISSVLISEHSYAQELPSRFAKEVTKAADVDGDGYISVSEVEKLLDNIGAKNSLSPDEITEVMNEIGSSEGPKGVPIQDVINYVKKSAKPGVA